MKTTLYMAISIDGCITRGNDDSDWVSETDWEEFNKQIAACDAVIMGRKTMEQFGEDFPIPGPANVVLSHSDSLESNTENPIYFSGEVADLVKELQDKGMEKLLLIGGADTNKQFLEANLIDEVILSVHPLAIGQGLHLFGDGNLDIGLQLLESKAINDELVQIRYTVQK